MPVVLDSGRCRPAEHAAPVSLCGQQGAQSAHREALQGVPHSNFYGVEIK